MDLYMKQKVFSWGDKFKVYDSNGNEKYYVEGEVFSLGKKLHIYDMSGNELAFIRQKILSFLPKYFVLKNDEQIAEVVKEFTLLRPKYSVRGPEWEVKGNFFEHRYEVTAGVKVIAAVSKEWFTWGDSYRISIADDADVVTALAVVLIIDACIEAQQNSSNN